MKETALPKAKTLKVLDLCQMVLFLSALAVVVRHSFFGWETVTYQLASLALILGVTAWIELFKQNIRQKVALQK